VKLKVSTAHLALLACVACARGPVATTTQPVQEGSGGINAPRWLDAPYVVLVSLDGFRADYLDRYPTPTLQRIAHEGARAEAMIPVFPSKTYPTHYTVATGLYAEHHGIVGNRFWDPERGSAYSINDRSTVEDGSWYRGEPIWVTAERQGMVSACFYFIGSEADIGGVRPTYWHRYDGSIPNEERVDAVLDWLAMPAERRPHMITLYMSNLDDTGHSYGPNSEQARDAVAGVDAMLGRLLDGIDQLPHGDRVYVVVTSDHGMLRSEAARAQVLDTAVFRGLRVSEWGPYASISILEGGAGRAAPLRDSLAVAMPEADVWLRGEVPERFHYRADPRIGDLLALAHPGATIVSPDRRPTRDGFTHGWDNAIPEMAAVFLARGPRIRAGSWVDPFESVNVYPLLAELLGLQPNPDIDGRLEVLSQLLAR
jgi:predicted AlkP superfamily pyrophosphatase or phosphodiesterase